MHTNGTVLMRYANNNKMCINKVTRSSLKRVTRTIAFGRSIRKVCKMEVLETVFYLAFIFAIVQCDSTHLDAKNSSVNRGRLFERDRTVIRIKGQGLLRGKSSEDGSYYKYSGIPYATVGSPEDRFKSWLPVPTWEGIRDSSDEDIQCVQRDYERVIGIEDCLILNVYVPARVRPRRRSLPVMVFVHGGDFNYGSSSRDMYGPDRFMKENVILVTINYRLSILGFLCIGDTANAGMKDVISALKWIQANIDAFGGDRGKVTLFGESTGAALVELLMLSKKTEGLFHTAIAQSGSAISPWAFGSNPEEKAFKVGKQLGYEGRDREHLMQVLRSANVTDLIWATETLTQVEEFEYLPIGPCIEPASNVDPIVTSDPRSTMESGDFNTIPYILGINKDEGMLIYATMQEVPNFLEIVEKDFPRSLPKDLQSPQLPTEKIAELVKQFYFGDHNISQNVVEAVKYFTDVSYTLPAVTSARYYIRSRGRHRRRAPVYVYEFAYDGGLALMKTLLNLTSVPGVCHADELGYLFTQRGVTSDRHDDQLTARRMVKLWTNFAKFSEPTTHGSTDLLPVEWEPADGDELKYLMIESDISLSRGLFKERIDFWDEIYKNYSIPLQ